MKQTPDLIQAVGYDDAVASVKSAVDALRSAQNALSNIKALAKIQCCRCSSSYPILTQTYIQTYWYVRPYSCNGGDYWNQGEGNWKCPSCGFRNRFEVSMPGTRASEFDRVEIVAAKAQFGWVAECYCSYDSKCEACIKGGLL